MLWCIGAKARFGSSLSPQPEGWGYSSFFSGRQPERQSYNSAIYGGDYIRNINAALAMTSKIAGLNL